MKAWLAGCRVHRGSQTEAGSHCLLRVNGRAVRALMDSGSTITLLHPAHLPWLRPSGETLPVSCMHGEIRHYPTARIRLEENKRHWPLTVGLVPDLPVPLLVGRDFPGFSQVQAKGGFAREQREDDRLKRAWEKVAVVDRVSHAPGPLPNPHFAVKNNLLYHVRLLPEGPQEALILPRSRIDAVMHLAHHHPLGGHLAQENTLARILPRFFLARQTR
ncbi:hypothetical protein SRHO_G00005650 [Serrasalmus rhombeus]